MSSRSLTTDSLTIHAQGPRSRREDRNHRDGDQTLEEFTNAGSAARSDLRRSLQIRLQRLRHRGGKVSVARARRRALLQDDHAPARAHERGDER